MTEGNVTLTRARAADGMAAVASLERAVFSDPWSERALLDFASSDGGRVYLATAGGDVVGYLAGTYYPAIGEGEILRLATREEFRRRGIARALIGAYIADVSHARVMLEVRAKNLPARALYRSIGFAEDGVRPGYYRAPDDDAVLMSAEF